MSEQENNNTPNETIPNNTVVAQSDSTLSSENNSFFSILKWGESYSSLLLGALVVIVAAILGFFYVKMHQPKQEILPPATTSRTITITETPSTVAITPTALVIQPTSTPEQIITPQPEEKTYIVKKNDNLWTIAEAEYGSGYNWVSIAQANHLANPGSIFSGNTLIIPSVTPILVYPKQYVSPTPTQMLTPTPPSSAMPNTAITGTEYVEKKGDSLWDIAVRAYGDGYKWVTIAKANNLTTPDMIFSGNVLSIPRSQTL